MHCWHTPHTELAQPTANDGKRCYAGRICQLQLGRPPAHVHGGVPSGVEPILASKCQGEMLPHICSRLLITHMLFDLWRLATNTLSRACIGHRTHLCKLSAFLHPYSFGQASPMLFLMACARQVQLHWYFYCCGANLADLRRLFGPPNARGAISWMRQIV